MPKKTSNVREIEVGDLVYHILYGHDWVGIILDIIDVYDYNDNRSSTHREMALVQMQPGTEYEYFFKKMVLEVMTVNTFHLLIQKMNQIRKLRNISKIKKVI